MAKLLFLFMPTVLFFTACEAKLLNINNNGTDIIAFGDSLSAGYGADKESSYPAALAAMINAPVINLGVSGDTARQGANRKSDILKYNPYMVLIEFGGNDAMRGRPFAETQNALEEIIDYVHKAGAIAVVVDTGGNFKMSPYGKMMKRLAKTKNALFIPKIMDGIFYNPALKSDAIHPNEKGYKIIAEKIYKRIKPYIKKNVFIE
ncbi:MAG: GDSL-type esterase/lipase family protein [Elusimicrobiota bacterium]|nr:GDSL-type esterase/lipase family protein [Elusimicrobiota bacterium]